MTLKRTTAFFTAAALAFLPAAQVLAETNDGEITEEKQYVIIAENESVYDTVAEEVEEDITVETPVLSENNVIVAELDEAEAEELEKRDDIVIEEDIILSGCTLADDMDSTEEMPADEASEYEWNIQAVNADEIIEDGAENVQKVKVAVLDSGVDYVTGINQEQYVNFVEGQEDFSPIFQDETGHGTGIASIISGNGETGIYGISPDADLYSVKVLDNENKAPLSRIIRGIYWCIENDMDIINMSFGTSVYSKALEQAVKDAYQAGLLMVGAAGNGSGAVEYPAAFPEVMAVASVNPEAEISEFSNTGEELDVAAPGEKVCVSSFFDGNVVTHGTSIAVPHVTGVAALLWAKDKSKSNEFIRQLIDCSAKDIEGTDDCGLLDAAYALSIYDDFAESFNENQEVLEENIPENTQMPESFEEVADDEAYVEGRWSGTNHQAAVDKSGISFSATEITLIKKGIVYPDEYGGWTGSADGEHPRWHGKRKLSDGTALNYVAAFEMITRIALNKGTVNFNASDVPGMTANIYYIYANDINGLQSRYADIMKKCGVQNTTENRKYFLYGCALHIITDAFAHSSTELNGNRITHAERADDTTYHKRRYDMAVLVTKYSLQNLKNNKKSNGAEVLKAINSLYDPSIAKFKLINIKDYLNQNGYFHAILDSINVNKY